MKKLSKHLLSFVLVCCMVFGLSISVMATSVSGDAGIKSMAVSPGALEPAFSTDVTEYSATVENSVDKILVGAEANDPGAKIVITGNAGLQVGENTVYVNVTATDGQTSKRYTITVIRQEEGAAAETPAAETAAPAETPAPAETAAGEQPTIAADPNAQGSGDSQNASLLPGLHNDVPEVTNPGFVSAAKLQEIEANYQQQLELRLYVIIGLAALCLILLIALAVSIGRGSKYAALAEEAQEALEAEAAYDEEPQDLVRTVEDASDYPYDPAAEIPLEAAVTAALAEAVSEIESEEELEAAEAAPEEINEAAEEAAEETSEDDGLEELSVDEELPAVPEADQPEEASEEAQDTVFVPEEAIPDTLDDLGDLFGDASEAESNDDDITFELPAEPEERVPVIYDRNAEKNVQAITVDEGNEELDDDFAMLESLLSDTNRQPEPFVMPEESPAAKPITLEEDDDFEILDL